MALWLSNRGLLDGCVPAARQLNPGPQGKLRRHEDHRARGALHVAGHRRREPQQPAKSAQPVEGRPRLAAAWHRRPGRRPDRRDGRRRHRRADPVQRSRRRAVELPQAVELARQANDAVVAAVTEYPGRFLGFATLPMRDPQAAVAELERTVATTASSAP